MLLQWYHMAVCGLWLSSFSSFYFLAFAVDSIGMHIMMAMSYRQS